jgi:hypothetical protein
VFTNQEMCKTNSKKNPKELSGLCTKKFNTGTVIQLILFFMADLVLLLKKIREGTSYGVIKMNNIDTDLQFCIY